MEHDEWTSKQYLDLPTPREVSLGTKRLSASAWMVSVPECMPYTACPLAINKLQCILQGLVASNSAALDVAELVKLCLKTFWSATWMEAPPILLQADQFAGWMTVLHTLLVRPVPEVRWDRRRIWFGM